MKKIIFFLFISFLTYSNLFPQTGWIVYPTGTNKVIRDIYFVDANTGWAVGDSVVVKSTDGGVNWVQQTINYPGGALLLSVKFINQNTGFVGGGKFTGEFAHAQYFFKTTNGGVNWNLLWNPQNTLYGWINNIFLINDNLIYITLSGYVEVNTLGGLYKSTNGGQNFVFCFSGGGHSSLFFINDNTGWTTSISTSDMVDIKTSKILRTNNGGLNWITQYRDSGAYSANINKVQFLNELTGYAIGSKYFDKTVFFKTTNGGINWDTLTYNNHIKNYSMYFLNPNTGWISGGYYPDSSSIAYTTNGGLNWQKQFRNNNYSVSRLYFINNFTGWATLGYNSSNILRTTTGGVIFINIISSDIPDKYLLSQNYPNPFNPNTNIRYQIPKSGNVKLKVYDILGKEIETFVNEEQTPGIYEVTFDASLLGKVSKLSSGIYFYRLETEGFSDTKRMILLK
jgi:photosystem II stability/assembly factor-like uncharacterized protein